MKQRGGTEGPAGLHLPANTVRCPRQCHALQVQRETAVVSAVTSLRELWHANVLPTLHLCDLHALESTTRAFRLVVCTAPDAVFHAAAERSGLPHTLFHANPGSTRSRISQAARVHAALRARQPLEVQCAPRVSSWSLLTNPEPMVVAG